MVREHLRPGFKGLIGNSPHMQKLWRGIARASSGRHPVLLIGENGTGKTLMGRLIHAQGLFPERPFVVVDCAAAPALVENQLFGQTKEELLCVSGTLFLDEVWALPPAVQAKLVRVLQEREIGPALRSGSAILERRIIAASTRDPEIAIQQGTFRRDLHARLSQVTLRIPPLRDRKEDILALAEHFLDKLAVARGLRRAISPEIAKVLENYEWPGNLRELRECMEHAYASCSAPAITLENLPQQVQHIHAAQGFADGSSGSRIVPLAEVEKQTILKALERLNGDKVMTARMLGIGKTTLYRKLKEYSANQPLMGPPITHH